MLVLAVTLHNIPEWNGSGRGLCRMDVRGDQHHSSWSSGAISGNCHSELSRGSDHFLPLKAEGMKKGKAFVYGVLSGAVEPIGAFLTILAAGLIIPALPYLLSFAAGAMMYVVVEELIPEMSEEPHSDIGTLLFAFGLTLMLALDVVLG